MSKRTYGHMPILGLFLLLLTMFALGGCSWWAPPQVGPSLAVVASPAEGHPSTVAGGLLVTFRCSGGTGKYDVDPGDGSSGFVVDGDTFTHTYTKQGAYRPIVSSGGGSKKLTIIVTNHTPHVYKPYTTDEYGVQWMDAKLFDARYQVHGCNTDDGSPVWAYGVYDPDGDPITAYLWHVTGPDTNGQTVSYSVFDENRNNITDQQSGSPYAVIFAGWTEANAPYPFTVYAPTHLNTMGELAPASCDSDPWCPPVIPSTTGVVTITITVWDCWGGEATKTWMMPLASTGCS